MSDQNHIRKPKIAFINQAGGRLFRQLAEDLSAKWSPAILFTGVKPESDYVRTHDLIIHQTKGYNRKNNITRLTSGLIFFLAVFVKLLRYPQSTTLFIVSNPPFILLLGYLFKVIKNQKYVILIYDLYPNILVSIGKFTNQSIIVNMWNRINRRIWGNAEIIFTIGRCMVKQIEGALEPRETSTSRVFFIPNCADPQIIKPINKRENLFAQKYNQLDKLTIMYSGNLGSTHNFDTLLNAAKKLIHNPVINFMIIGEGSQKKHIKSIVEKDGLHNVVLLPYQDEDTFPFSLAAGDVAIITMSKGTEGLMVPSKIYTAMAAGSALLGICDGDVELKRIIKIHNCGIHVEHDDVDGIIKAIKKFEQDATFFERCKKNSRLAFENNYTKMEMSKQYIEVLSKHFEM